MLIILILILSVCVGLLLQKHRGLRHLERSATYTVWLLIFVFGISLGSNREIVSDFGRFGFTAAVIAVAGVAGSVLAAWGVKSFIAKKK